MRTIGMALVLMLSLLVTSCSSDSDDGGDSTPGASGVAGNKKLSELNADDIGKLCDWGASLYGGYGMEVTCDDGSTSRTQSSREACTADADFATCHATVSQFEACIPKVHDLCLSALATAQCAPI